MKRLIPSTPAGGIVMGVTTSIVLGLLTFAIVYVFMSLKGQTD